MAQRLDGTEVDLTTFIMEQAAMATTPELENARRLQKAILTKVERQRRTLEDSQAELAGIEAYIRGLEKTSK